MVGVLEPSVPYPADTEIIANVVTSPHHLGATMNLERTHRMTELFGRLAPGASVEDARAELTAIHADGWAPQSLTIASPAQSVLPVIRTSSGWVSSPSLSLSDSRAPPLA